MSQRRLPDFHCCNPAPSSSLDITPHERCATGSPGLWALGAPAPAPGFSSNGREYWPGRSSLDEPRIAMVSDEQWGAAQDNIQHSWLSFPGVTRAQLMAPLCCHSPGEGGTLCRCSKPLSVKDSDPQTSCCALPEALPGVSACQFLLLSFSQVRPMGWAQAA